MTLESSFSKRRLDSFRPLRVPRFRFHLKVETVGRDTVIVSSEGECLTLTETGLAMIARQINGRNTVEQITARLRGTVSSGSVYVGILVLQVSGAIVETERVSSTRLRKRCDLLGSDPECSSQRLSDLPVSVVSVNGAGLGKMKRALRELDLQVRPEGWLTVVIVQDYLQEELDQINREARREKRPWMLVKATGSTVWWGPLFTPGGTGCWSCLAQRLRKNRWSKTLSRMAGTAIVRNGRSDLALGGLPEAGFKLAALSLFQWVTNPDYHDLEDRVYSLNGQSLVLSHHRFSRLEHCPVCGNTEKKVPGNPGLPAGELQAEVDGRSCSTEQTFERLRHHISPVTGICGSLEPLFESDSIPIYVYEAGRPFGLRGKPAWFPGSSSIFWATGRGASRLEARTGALCESIERHAGTFRGCEPTVVSTFRELGPAAVDPNSIMNFSARQYSERELSREIPNTWIPEPLDEGCAIEWTPVWSLTEGTVKYVPTALCYYGYEGAGTRFCKADSNGCAAGNTAEEAIAHGLLELVERDAAAIWWYNQISRAGVDLDSLDDPWISRVDGYHDGLGRELEVLEITSDLQIPTFVSISRARSGSLSDLILGFGSSLSPLSAIKRSILEMHQLLPLILAGGSTQRETGLTESMQANDSWLRPSDRRSLKSAADLGIPSRRIPATSGRRGGPDLEVCLDLARKQGLEVLVLDHTSREVDLAVVRVFVPTLRPWWARFGPGRLYDVPVKMKWRSGPCAEENLNKANLIF